MAPCPPCRVLRCYSCHLFQVHQVKKSLKWTCKACGEKQSFVRAYGEGSGADCRRHVQKLNLLQGQVSELSSLRSLGEATGTSRESSGPQQADGERLQGRSEPLESRWLKYLDRNIKEPKLGGDLQAQPTTSVEQPDPPFSPALPRKRDWSQNTTQTSCFLDVQGLDKAEGTLECQSFSDLTVTQQSSSHCIGIAHCHPRDFGFPRCKLPSPALQVKASSSKWARFLLSPGDRPHVDTEPSRPLHWDSRPASPAQAEQGTPETKTPKASHLSGSPTSVHLPWATYAPTANPEGSNRKFSELSWSPRSQTEGGLLADRVHKAPPMQLHNLFVTGEDFEEDL